jgi:hypothetical protein
LYPLRKTKARRMEMNEIAAAEVATGANVEGRGRGGGGWNLQ